MYFKDKYAKSQVQIRKIDGTKNYFLEEMKHDEYSNKRNYNC